MDKRLLDILACPLCKGPLVYRKAQGELAIQFGSLEELNGVIDRLRGQG